MLDDLCDRYLLVEIHKLHLGNRRCKYASFYSDCPGLGQVESEIEETTVKVITVLFTSFFIPLQVQNGRVTPGHLAQQHEHPSTA